MPAISAVGSRGRATWGLSFGVEPDTAIAEPLKVDQHPGVEEPAGDPTRPVGRNEGFGQPPIDPVEATAASRSIDGREIARHAEPGHRLLRELELVRDVSPGVRGGSKRRADNGQLERRAHRSTFEALAGVERSGHGRVAPDRLKVSGRTRRSSR